MHYTHGASDNTRSTFLRLSSILESDVFACFMLSCKVRWREGERQRCGNLFHILTCWRINHSTRCSAMAEFQSAAVLGTQHTAVAAKRRLYLGEMFVYRVFCAVIWVRNPEGWGSYPRAIYVHHPCYTCFVQQVGRHRVGKTSQGRPEFTAADVPAHCCYEGRCSVCWVVHGQICGHKKWIAKYVYMYNM